MMRASATHLQASYRSAAFAALLTLCLLFAQALGFAHAYAHAGGAHEAATSQQSSDQLFHHAKTSCAAFDAATLGAGLHTAAFDMPAMVACKLVPSIPAAEDRALQTRTHFNSRAPPQQA